MLEADYGSLYVFQAAMNLLTTLVPLELVQNQRIICTPH